MQLLAKLKKNWFLIGIVLVILSANYSPEFGKKGGKNWCYTYSTGQQVSATVCENKGKNCGRHL